MKTNAQISIRLGGQTKKYYMAFVRHVDKKHNLVQRVHFDLRLSLGKTLGWRVEIVEYQHNVTA